MKNVIKTKTEELQFGIYDDKREEFIPIADYDDAKQVAKEFDINETILKLFVDVIEDIKEYVVSDLKDIWQRLNSVESELLLTKK